MKVYMAEKTVTVTGSYNVAKLGGAATRSRVPKDEQEPDQASQKTALGAALLGHISGFENWDVRGEIRRKLRGYRAQDVARRRAPAPSGEAPDEEGTIERLLASNMQ